MSYLQISTAMRTRPSFVTNKDLQLGNLQFETSILAEIVLSHSFTASHLSRNNKEPHPRDPVSFEEPQAAPPQLGPREGMTVRTDG